MIKDTTPCWAGKLRISSGATWGEVIDCTFTLLTGPMIKLDGASRSAHAAENSATLSTWLKNEVKALRSDARAACLAPLAATRA